MTSMNTAHGALFQSYQLGRLTLRNRILQTPLSVCYADAEGYVTRQMIDHYSRRAAGGAAMIIVENMAVDEAGRQLPRQAVLSGRDRLAGLAELAAGIKRYGAAAVVQIVHAGRYAGPWDAYETRRRLAPSAIDFPLLPGRIVRPQEITREEIEQTIASFAAAARLLGEAGFDGVEIHGAQGFLISSFQSPRMNQRFDEYGVDPNRFAFEVIDAVRNAVHPDFLIGYHLFADELMPGGWTCDDAVAFAAKLPDHGIDFVLPMASTFESLRAPENVGLFDRPDFQRDLTRRVAAACSLPVFTNGRLGDPDLAASIVSEGEAPMVGLGRPLLADPDWPMKVRTGRSDEIAVCACTPSTCLQTQLEGVVCGAWPASAIDAGVFGLGQVGEFSDAD